MGYPTWAQPIIDLVMTHEGMTEQPSPSACWVGGDATPETADSRSAIFHDLAHASISSQHCEGLAMRQLLYAWLYGEEGDISHGASRMRRRGDDGAESAIARFPRMRRHMQWLVQCASERLSYDLDRLSVAVA